MKDLILLHAPSIYDFRKRYRIYGPVSDVIPSTPIFEMYPIGFISLISDLIPKGYKVNIENLAVQMILHENLDVERKISKLDASMIAMDLHWLPHVHGVINIAKMVKKYHPDTPIILGGLSSTYFYKELINFPFIDFILLGDTTEPFFSDLIETYQKNGDFSKIPNLVWKDNGRVRINNIENPENYINSVKLDYHAFMKMCFSNLKIESSFPYSDWTKSPSAMTFIQKGCHHNCLICGGSKFSYENFYFRKSVSYRPVDNVIEDLISIQENLGVPAFIIGDIHQAGQKYQKELLSKIKENGIDIPIMFEIFNPAPEEYYQDLEKNVSEYTMEISPESSSEEIRARAGRYYTNFALEKNLDYAKKHGARKMDVFFSIGLSGQKIEDVFNDIKYMDRIWDKYSSWLHMFTSPIAPFLDPGSLAFERNELYGYRIFARTLMDHYNLLDKSVRWTDALNYETLWMKREDIGLVSLKAGYEIANLRLKKGLDSNPMTVEKIQEYISTVVTDGGDPLPRNYIGPIIYSKDELVWSRNIRIKSVKCLGVNLYRKIYNLLFGKNL